MALKATVRTFGAVNILCCFAGVVGCTPSVDVKAGEWKRVMDINCNGIFLCAQTVARYDIPIVFGYEKEIKRERLIWLTVR
jgi:NAD(P)-dependent dehydrogenase (short-subunit alcohol dehydrogenase family)